MDVKTLCLGVLTQGEASGYDIKKYFDCAFSHFFLASFGSIYPALNDLARDGQVTCRDDLRPNRPDRKLYSLTDKGREAFNKVLASTRPRHHVRSEFFALLHFAHLLPAERLNSILDERVGDLTHALQELQRVLDACDANECELEPAQCFEIELTLCTMKAHRDYILANREKLLQCVTEKQPDKKPNFDYQLVK